MSANRKSFKQNEDILIVDDELANLRLLTELLSDAGYHVRPTREPRLAIESAQAQPPDLILLDVRMPKMDGFEVCRRLKQDERTRDIPILFVSALQGVQDRVRGFEAGALDFVSKPIQETELLARVRTHMDLHNMQSRLEELVAERTAELELEIIERKHAEEDMQESRALFDSYLSVAPVGTAIFDTGGRFVNLNEEFAKFAGISSADHLGKYPGEILPGWLGKDSDDQIQRMLRTSQPIINEEISGEIFSEPSVTRHWLRSLFPIYGARKDIKGIGAMLVEITEAKRTEEQLRQSQKMEALGTLAGGVAHDINNMLYPILVNAGLLLEKCEADSDEYALLTDVVGSARQARDLVSQILVFGRRGDIIERICDFVSVANEAMKLLRPALPETISIELNFSSARVPVLCDSSQLYQVLVNLFTNAEQAIVGSGEIKIAIDTVEIEKLRCIHGRFLNGTFARLAVTDNGVGMDDKTCAKMFDPFFTTKEKGQGTGLGLSTVFGIVQNHRGGITVSCELGIGTTIEIYLPLAEDILDESDDKTVSSLNATNDENILFVDDVESIRNSVMVCLERSGYKVTTASSGQEALETFLANPDHFNLVITDQAMANMTGEELSSELLRLRPDIPIVICTGHSEVISPESSREMGIRAFLQKPATPMELRRVVREVLDEADPGH